jgi:hypothetical protein
MTDPTIGVGAAAARAPQLEPSGTMRAFDALIGEIEAAGDEQKKTPWMHQAWHRRLTWLRWLRELRRSEAARSPREPLEPEELCPTCDGPVVVTYPTVGEPIYKSVAAARSALPPPELLEPAAAIYLSDLAHDHAGQVQAGSESVEHALRTVAVCAYEHGVAALPRAPEPDLLKALDERICLLPREGPPSRPMVQLGYVLEIVRAARAGAEAPPVLSEVQIAERIARQVHEGQTEEYTGDDYIHHIERVVALVDGDQAKAVAWLHDVIEDTDVSAGELSRAGMSDTIIDVVLLLTRDPDRDSCTYAEYIEHIRQTRNPLALAVKCADLIDHLRPHCPARLRPRYEKALKSLTAARVSPTGAEAPPPEEPK